MKALILVCMLACSGCLAGLQAHTQAANDVSTSLEEASQYYIAAVTGVLSFCAGVPAGDAAAAKFCAQVPGAAETLTAKFNVLFSALRAFSASQVDPKDQTSKVINVPVEVGRQPFTDSDGE